jgi:hypothetical protein
MPIPSTMADLSITAASNFPAGSESPTTGDDYLRAYAAILRTTNAKGADIASASTTDIGAATGEFVDVTGTTTITGLGTIAAGIKRTVRFTGALTLTHNATSLILPGSANITTANGDVAEFRSLGSGNWKCTSYISQAGLSPSGVAKADIQKQTYTAFTTGGTSTAYTLTPTPALASLTTGHRFNVTFNATAGAAPTLAISGLTAKSLKVYDPSGAKVNASSTSIVANLNSDVIYDGTDYVVLSPTRPQITSSTAQATTSGSAIDFTGIPSWVKEIIINLSGVSTNGTGNLLIQIGDSGGIETTGYLGAAWSTSAASGTLGTTGFIITSGIAAASIIHGSVKLTLLDSTDNTWASFGNIAYSNAASVQVHGGSKSLSATLDRVRLLTADTFDAGKVSLIYKG